MNASWKTSVFGMLAAIGSGIVLDSQTTHILASLPPWLVGLGGLCSIVGMAGMGLAARDNNVTSEQAGAAPSVLPAPVKVTIFAVFITLCISLATGCVHLAEGADPLVVNAERTLTVGKGAFDLILNVDDSNRPYWTTNAPPFHQFCEWLRVPVTITSFNGVTNLPRCSGILWNLDQIKLGYKIGKASSNDLAVALSTATTVVTQAQSWSSIVTNTVIVK